MWGLINLLFPIMHDNNLYPRIDNSCGGDYCKFILYESELCDTHVP